jgi:hypothetical protein
MGCGHTAAAEASDAIPKKTAKQSIKATILFMNLCDLYKTLFIFIAKLKTYHSAISLGCSPSR